MSSLKYTVSSAQDTQQGTTMNEATTKRTICKQSLTIVLTPILIRRLQLEDLLPFEFGQTANEQTRKFLLGVIKICLDYIERENDRSEKVIDFYQPEEMMKMFDFSIPESPLELDRLIEDCKRTLSYQVKTGHPHFFNQLSNGLDIVSLAGEWLTAAANTNMFTYEIAPVFILMEHFVLEKMRHIIGFMDGDSILAPGGAISNLYSVIVARHKMFPECKTKGMRALPQQLVMFTSEHSHYSSKGAGSTCGFGVDNVIEVPCDERGRMRADELERLVTGRIQAGDRPFYVNCTCGTTVLGAFDPVNPIADICAKYNMWLHIDAAWGGGCLLSPKLRHKLAGIERANSVTWNPHKLMACVLQCSTIHFREKNLLMNCNQMCADYLFQQDKQYDVGFDTGDKVIQCGRHNDIFKLWLMWRARGTSGYAAHMEHLFEMTSYQVERIKQEGDKFLLLWPEPECTNVCFWYIPRRLRGQPRSAQWDEELGRITAQLKSKMMHQGTLMIGYQPLGHTPNFFRSIISSSAVQRKDIDFMLAELDRLGADL